MRVFKRVVVLLRPGTRAGRDIYRGACRYAKSLGRAWDFQILTPTGGDVRAYHRLAQRRVDGCIGYTRSASAAEAAAACPFPVVSAQSGIEPCRLPLVSADDAAIGRLAAQYFLDLGFRSFGLAAWSRSLRFPRRVEGFAQALRRQGINPRIEFIPRGIPGVAPDDPACRFVRALPKPAAIFAVHDFVAGQVLIACRHMRIIVPEQVAILGVDDDDLFCEGHNPSLSSVEWPMEEVGYQAARILDRLMTGRKPGRLPVILPPKAVHVRQSTDILAIDDPLVARALACIRDNACLRLRVPRVARELAVSRQTLGARFRKALGRGVFQEIRRVQVQRVQQLLRDSDRPIREIAELCGFADNIALARAFRATTGMTCSGYRRQYNA